MNGIKDFVFKHHIAIFFSLTLLIFGCFLSIPSFRVESFFTLVGSLAAFVYFVQRQKLDDHSVFNDLFRDFNKRYGELNKDLNKIRSRTAQLRLGVKEKDILYSYFNLCGEEYLAKERGFIYPEVWNSWRKGMKIFLDNERIRILWNEEARTESYYGLEREFPVQ